MASPINPQTIMTEFSTVQADIQVITGMTVAGGDYTKYYDQAESNLKSLVNQLTGNANVPQSVFDNLNNAANNLATIVKKGNPSVASLAMEVDYPVAQAFSTVSALFFPPSTEEEEKGGPAGAA